MNSSELIFAYGSLKRGFYNHHILVEGEFLGKAQTKERFSMVSFGTYPAAIKIDGNGFYLLGELYRVTGKALKELDDLEGEGSFYKRELIELEGQSHGSLSQNGIEISEEAMSWTGRESE